MADFSMAYPLELDEIVLSENYMVNNYNKICEPAIKA